MLLSYSLRHDIIMPYTNTLYLYQSLPDKNENLHAFRKITLKNEKKTFTNMSESDRAPKIVLGENI